jgi:3-oxoadipate enol-lactonase
LRIYGTKGGATIPNMQMRSDDAEIQFEVVGEGPDVVLLHPFPSSRTFWNPITAHLKSRYRLIMPDLRGLGGSTPGEGIATMKRHSEDLLRLCDELRVGKAVFVGCSIGGYILFEAWRRFHERFRAVILCDTKAEADDDLARANRLRIAEDVLLRGVDPYIASSLPKLVGETTQRNRPDIYAAARATTVSSTPKGIAAVQRGMAAREDSSRTLPRIDVPALVMVGEEDAATPPEIVRSLAQRIPKSEFHLIPAAGHFSAFEQPDAFVRILRQFLDRQKLS